MAVQATNQTLSLTYCNIPSFQCCLLKLHKNAKIELGLHIMHAQPYIILYLPTWKGGRCERTCRIYQCLQAVLLPFSINNPIFQYFAYIFSIFQYFTKSSIYDVCTEFPQFSVFYQYLWSEFSKNTDKSVYLEALIYQ